MSAPAIDVPPPAGYTEWQGPWTASRRRRGKFFRSVLWSLLYPPPRGERVSPTLTGILLIAVSLAIGTAAYNSSNNILYITLSLLLSCLVLSGVLSWLNLREVGWRLHLGGPWRAGQVRPIGLELRSGKTMLPTYALWFELEAGVLNARRHLTARLDPGENHRLEWPVSMPKRGRIPVRLRSVGSLYPFGFLRKSVASEMSGEVLVWPATVPYERNSAGAVWRTSRGRGTEKRSGREGELQALRRYVPGDAPRLVHWKASARLRHLMVRQFSAEGVAGFTLRLCNDASVWTRPEQFELAVGLTATLAEDLFQQGCLHATMVGEEAPVEVRQWRDVERFLDRLAVLEREQPEEQAGAGRFTERKILTVEPQGPRGVAAMIDGKPAATA